METTQTTPIRHPSDPRNPARVMVLEVTKQSMDWQDRCHGRQPRVYFFQHGETVLQNFAGGRYLEPHRVFRTDVMPWLLEWAGFPVGTTFKWSQRAGCQCPCSPGFIIKGDGGFGSYSGWGRQMNRTGSRIEASGYDYFVKWSPMVDIATITDAKQQLKALQRMAVIKEYGVMGLVNASDGSEGRI